MVSSVRELGRGEKPDCDTADDALPVRGMREARANGREYIEPVAGRHSRP